ncbi:hypothetical protein [Neisseria iguanae]|uniref:Uncharacterized protein n=1 Tax=Neisseria iguanae TaxID=90242 RepID=A0A2P7U072_9NEIS|nr:hypothetical protein [Neisseria iguanae]PSJ80364.1 hypothetical protein C7N83_06755 [Neisseria iguanae]
MRRCRLVENVYVRRSISAGSIGFEGVKDGAMHWGVFSLGRNPWYESINNAVKSAREHSLVLDVPKMGEKYADGFIGKE